MGDTHSMGLDEGEYYIISHHGGVLCASSDDDSAQLNCDGGDLPWSNCDPLWEVVNQGGDNYSLTYIPTGLQMVSFGGEEICKVNGGPFPWESGETGAHFEIVEADGFEGGYHIRNVWIAGEKEEGQLYCWSREDGQQVFVNGGPVPWENGPECTVFYFQGA